LVDRYILDVVALGDVLPVASEIAVVKVAVDDSVPLWLGKSSTDTAAKGGSFGNAYVKGR